MLEDTPGNRLYLRLVETALEDSIVTDDEASILRILSHTLGVQPSDTALCISIAKGEEQSPFDKDESLLELPMGSVSTYQSALIAALDDEVITEDEWALLDHLRQLLGIQPDQHGMIEEAIHAMSDVDEQGRKRLERLERFMTVCPFA
ncbi:hypothetical protein N9Y75_05155 [Candidatus Poseidoniales archaeon]|nr:hypothetical protein [Candidatus Poseidoniales archaeon]MDA8777595.1 hypothetical protein [Candidatus Poseidoniales archaeon]MDB2366928.1 hypothetical protein [Candidatus Poseidoniales archaeon]MDB2672221.1 hypothetical protein [Candidatus Poseidoniales archaeon]|tara:strand:- start:1084 stop:1527 length:444 start_codon:yes stop_codon:yes gene_type:complete